jgi:hypothetical protein
MFLWHPSARVGGRNATSEIVLAVDGVDEDALDGVYASLRRDLAEAGFDPRVVSSDAAPDGAKSGLQLAGLAVNLAGSLTPAVVNLLIFWKGRQRSNCQLQVELPDGQKLALPLGETEARALLHKHLDKAQ